MNYSMQRDLRRPIRVLYSFPHKLGAARVCYTAWQQVSGVAAAGADLKLAAGWVHKPVDKGITVNRTLGFGPLRIPYKLLGTMRACALHDHIVARRLEALAKHIDLVHTWPLGARETLRTARRLGIRTLLERPNAHTRFAYDVVQRECSKVGVRLPRNHEHSFKADVLEKEEEEYELATGILCPSDFVRQTFIDQGFPCEQLVRHQYGFDESVCYPGVAQCEDNRGLRALFAGGCAPRKGLHYALHAWLSSSAHESGTLSVAGDFVPGYVSRLAPQLAHPSVRLLGFRRDLPQLMRENDILILPSVEEGSALVTYEARGCGCVLLVSDAAGAVCTHSVDALVHQVGDVETLSRQLTALHNDRGLLRRLRAASLATLNEITWRAAGRRLLEVYESVLDS